MNFDSRVETRLLTTASDTNNLEVAPGLLDPSLKCFLLSTKFRLFFRG